MSSILGWIFGLIIGFVVGLVVLAIRNMTQPKRIENSGKHLVKTDSITRESLWIPIKDEKGNDQKLFAEIYRSVNTPKVAPFIIFAHGLGGFHNDLHFEALSAAIALAGYSVLSYDHRGHGQTKIADFKKNGFQEFSYLYADISQVIDFVEKREDLDNGRIGVIGFSLGGGVVLCHPLNDPRVKIIVAGCAIHDMITLARELSNTRPLSFSWFFSLAVKRQILIDQEQMDRVRPDMDVTTYAKPDVDYSKKVFLAHCKDDKIVPFYNFEKNKEILRLPDENTLVFEQGGHEFVYMTIPLVSQIIKWLKNL